jgi:type IV secretory pathway ATPase VirB11/archaellum biosynthesis ATPase
MTITNISLHHFAEKLFLPFLEEAEITEIAINRPEEIWYEKQGIWRKNDDPNITNKLIKSFAIALASFNETSVDDCQPILSGTLETGEYNASQK